MSHKHKHEHPGPPVPAAPGPDAAPAGAAPEGAAAPPAPDATALQAETDDLLKRLQRVSADYLNYQKRIQKEVRQSREFANEELLKALLPILDDVEKAVEAGAAGRPPDDPLLTGLRLIQEKVLATLGQFGLASIECQGLPFDPDRHSAVVQEPNSQHPPQTVVRELRKGYTMHGRTIRPSMVAVSVEPAEAEPPRKQE